MRVKLSISVAPLAARGPANSLFSGPSPVWRRPQDSQQKFVHFSDSEASIGTLWLEIEAAYKRKYLTQSEYGEFGIKKLQDGQDNDLDTSYTVGELFEEERGEKIIRVIQTYVDRESSIPITSSLRPAGLPAFKRPLPPVPAFDSNKRRKVQDEETLNPYTDVHPDRPVRSRERSVRENEVIERAEDAESPERLNGFQYQSTKYGRDRIISDSDDERVRERNLRKSILSLKQHSSARRSSAQQISEQRGSLQQSSLQQSSRQEISSQVSPAPPRSARDSSALPRPRMQDSRIPSEPMALGEESDDDYPSSPELETHLDDLPYENQEIEFVKPDIPASSVHPRSSSIGTPRESAKDDKLAEYVEELPQHNSVTSNETNGREQMDIYEGPFHTDDERADTISGRNAVTVHRDGSQNTPTPKKFFAQRTPINTTNTFQARNAQSVTRSAHTNVSHAESPIHKIVDSQKIRTITSSRDLHHALQANRDTPHQAKSSGHVPGERLAGSRKRSSREDQMQVTSDLQEHSGRTFATENENSFAESEYDQSDQVTAVMEEDQLLSASPEVTRQLAMTSSPGLRGKQTPAKRPQRRLNSHDQSTKSSLSQKRSTARATHPVAGSFTSSTSLPTQSRMLQNAENSKFIEPSLPPSSAPSLPLPVINSREIGTSDGWRTPSEPRVYLDERDNDISSPVKHAKELTQKALMLASQSVEPERDRHSSATQTRYFHPSENVEIGGQQLRSESQQRQLSRKNNKIDDDKARDYLQQDMERTRFSKSGQNPEIYNISGAMPVDEDEFTNRSNEREAQEMIEDPMSKKTRPSRASKTKANAKITGGGEVQVDDTHNETPKSQRAQLLERNRIMKEKELKQKQAQEQEQKQQPTQKESEGADVVIESREQALHGVLTNGEAIHAAQPRAPLRGLTTILKATEEGRRARLGIEPVNDSPGDLNQNVDTSFHRSRISSSSTEDRGNMSHGATFLGPAVVINSPAEQRKARQTQGDEPNASLSRGVSMVSQTAILSQNNMLGSTSAAEGFDDDHTMVIDETTVARNTGSTEHPVSEVIIDNYRAEPGSSKPSEAFRKFLPEVPAVPSKRKRQTKTTASSTGSKSKPAVNGHKMQTRLLSLNETPLVEGKGKAKLTSKSPISIPAHLQDQEIEISDDSAEIAVQAPLLKKGTSKGPSQLKSRKATSTVSPPLEKSNSQSMRSSSSKSPVTSRNAAPTPGVAAQDTPAVAFPPGRLADLPIGLEADDEERPPAQYIPSSPSQSSDDDEMGLEHSTLDIAAAVPLPPSSSSEASVDSLSDGEDDAGSNAGNVTRNDAGSTDESDAQDDAESDAEGDAESDADDDAESGAEMDAKIDAEMDAESDAESDAGGDSEMADEASPVSLPTPIQSSLNTELDAALQRDAQRSAAPSSSLANDGILSQSAHISQRTMNPVSDEQESSPDWAAQQQNQSGKKPSTYDSATKQPRGATRPTEKAQSVPEDDSEEHASESSDEPTSTESDADDESDGSSESSDDDAGNALTANTRKSPQIEKEVNKVNVTPRQPATKSSAPTTSTSTTSTAKSSPARNQITQPRAPTNPIPDDSSSSLSSSSEDESSDPDSPSSDDSATERIVAERTANVTDESKKRRMIRSIRGIASYTRKMDRAASGAR